MAFFFEFNGGEPGQPLAVVSCANGFTPQAYARALEPLYATHRVVSANMRPLWAGSAALPPESLTGWRQLGDDLLRLLDDLTPAPAAPVVGIGHSVGGVTSVYAALRRPERFSHLILIDPTFLRPRLLWGVRLFRGLGRGHRMPLVRSTLRRRRLWPSVEDAAHHLSARSLFKRWQPDVFRDFVTSAVRPARDGDGVTLVITPEWEAQIFKTVAADVWSLPGQLRRLRMPTLVIRGEHTDVFTDLSARLFAGRYPEARIETVRGAGHLIPQENPEVVGALMRDFLRDVRGSADRLDLDSLPRSG
jgi:pimeloyl-ACP methyl ester carboxylesterase